MPRRRRPPPNPFGEPAGLTSSHPSGSENWRERIARVFERLSASNRKVASFLLERPTEAAFMSGSQVAEHLDLDPATIVRFAQSLGYPGYPELAADVRESVRSIFTVSHEVTEPTEGTSGGEWRGGLQASAAAVRAAAEGAAWRDARRVVKLLAGARNVVVAAREEDRLLAEWLAHNLRLAGLRALAAAEGEWEQSLTDGDALIALAVAAPSAAAAALQVAGERGAQALAIAANGAATAGAELALTLPTTGAAASVAYFALVEALRQAVLASLRPEPKPEGQ